MHAVVPYLSTSLLVLKATCTAHAHGAAGMHVWPADAHNRCQQVMGWDARGCTVQRTTGRASAASTLDCRFAVSEGDLIAYLNVWKAWEVRRMRL